MGVFFVFCSVIAGAALALASLFGGTSLWFALVWYSFGGAIILLGAVGHALATEMRAEPDASSESTLSDCARA